MRKPYIVQEGYPRNEKAAGKGRKLPVGIASLNVVHGNLLPELEIIKLHAHVVVGSRSDPENRWRWQGITNRC
ncbi:hypothetical protein DSUL_20187 [Desulfovibrionales bacterium]